MLFEHPDQPGRGVRLAYCLNLHPADDFAGTLRGLEEVTLPLAERLGGASLRDGFGVGMWLPGPVALELTADEGHPDLDRLVEFLAEHRLDAFTFNAFPYGEFHGMPVKERVFRPSWQSPERLAYTISVARIAEALRAARDTPVGERDHVSISTHTGMYGAWIGGDEDLDGCASTLAEMTLYLSQMESESGLRILLSLEPEPDSLVPDTRRFPGYMERIRTRALEVLGRGEESLRDVVEAIVRRHLGACLDACHAAVEFEEPEQAYANATAAGVALGKLQYSSALALPDPASNEAGRTRLLAMDEPTYLHQVVGRRAAELLHAPDLPALGTALEEEPSGPWTEADEWRCHFHVPVDRAELGDGLRTTRPEAEALLARALADPERWGTHELHLEIETYTWDVLPETARGAGSLVDALEREYACVIAQLEAAGWRAARV